jgi:gamma-glutamyltranspeptidase/glutathione hydrolase
VLDDGGNAVDAAVAAALCAGVVQPASSGLGGGGFAVVVPPSGAPWVLDFREVAPAAATRDMFAAEGLDPRASQDGGLAVAVPSESLGLATLHARWGRLPAASVAAPAIALARDGYVVSPHLASRIAATKSTDVARSYAQDTSRGPLPTYAGSSLRRPAHARTLAAWARTGGRDLMTGRGAAAIVRDVQQAGGVLTLDDLAAYKPVERAPIRVTWGEWTFLTMPPPSSGGVALAEVLQALDADALRADGLNSSAYIHRVVEAMKHAYADRAHHLGDPAFVDVPVERLIRAERAAEIRAAFDPARTLPTAAYGSLIAPLEDAGTQHISVVDPSGMAVSLTTTINTSFGSGIVVDDLGIVLNNQMDDFAAKPGVPNAYGLIGDEANAIAPGKRPLSSMSPTVVLDADGRVILSIGASGGSQIISGTLEVLLAILVFDLSPATATALPRFHHQWQPDELVVEPEIPADVITALRARGHTVVVRTMGSSVQAVRFDGEVASAGSDPRKGGAPAIQPR